ncbi:MAG TPA: hypothetical protein VF841_19695, partial [Anaeromyxobacter sp.]
LEPLAAALQQALEDVDVTVLDEEASGGGPALPSGGDASARGGGDDAGAERPAPDRTVPPRWSLEDARAALAAARHRDEVVLTAIRYARDFFEYAAVFAVTRDAVAGHDALGLHDERDRARSVAIWATDPGIFKTVIETRAPHLGPVSREASGNEAILSGLGRESPRAVLLYPVLLRDRPVCVVYADNGEAPVSPGRLGDLLLFLSGVGAALERILQDRKRRGRAGRPAGPDPGAAPGAEASRRAEDVREAPVVGGPGPRAGSEAEPVAPVVRAAPEPLPVPVDAPAPARGEAAAQPSLEEAGPPDLGIPVDLPPFEFEPPPVEAPQAPAAGAGGLEDVEEAFFSSGPRAPAAPEREKGAPAEGASSGPTPTATATPTAAPGPIATPTAPPPADARPPPEPPTLAALADRALDPDGATAAAACEALAARRREPASRTANEKLRRALLSGISARATRAARALGAIRDVEAIPLLIQVLETSEPETAGASADALAAITLQRLGPDARKWLAWWKQNRGRGRAEWLFSGLTSADRETRVAASVELSLAAPAPVAYSADLPPDERERLARAWAGWWARSGHVL